jgi:hypothetical protein
MLVLACFALAVAILTAIELDRELGGRWRGYGFMVSCMWVLMFAASIDNPDSLLGFTGYLLIVVSAAQTVLFIGVLVKKARRRWATWHDVES